MASVSWLDVLEQELNIDVDWMDPDFLVEMRPTIKFHDLTSNQNFVDIQMGHPSNVELLRDTAREVRDEYAAATEAPAHPLWLAIYTRMAVRMCKKVVDHISGRVLLQTSPSQAYDTAATVAHAHLYDAEFSQVNISRDRFCIKIPCTGPALNAAKMLQTEGIQTLGTALFGVPQAMAASQARCLSISPYFNDVRAHEDRSCWPSVADPAVEHPNAARLVQILDLYRRLYAATGERQPLVKNASFVSPEEAMAAGEMGCHSATLFHTAIRDLAAHPYTGAERPGGAVAAAACVPKPAADTPFYKDRKAPSARLQPLLSIDPLNTADPTKVAIDYDTVTKVDYLADNGKLLDAAIEADPVAKDRLAAALTLFIACEKRSEDKVDKALASL
ncbi:transaldolase [Sporothrix schenckii 1099-18]|uniref:Transaldolase n=2 Tax=Sporothrix schenckii TaxID=29908 RepID=U7PY38_SPOS1|nr:transaldolase [Sporothrix schenckii 1099-18]ERT00503.1 hypothetical protein HMPREF1624_03876 [Sporothrix schenckii ATCC 58251]KJR84993.1 transaldolase [Sporothrix schenckii 1099-18]